MGSVFFYTPCRINIDYSCPAQFSNTFNATFFTLKWGGLYKISKKGPPPIEIKLKYGC